MAEVSQLQPTHGTRDVAIRGWRTFITNSLAEKIGVLADIVVNEALEASGIDERRLGIGNFNRFLAALYVRLPPEIDRRALIAKLHADVIRRLFASLRRDLEARLDEAG